MPEAILVGLWRIGQGQGEGCRNRRGD